MNIPNELKYTKSHEWLRMADDGTAEIGLTDYAQKKLGALVFVNLPEPGDTLTAGETFADVESVKAVSDVYSPVTASVTEINEMLMEESAQINSDPYGAWLVRVENISQTEELLTAAEYQALCEKEG